jgi:hypothetical protein
MSQKGQLFPLKQTGREGEPLWAYRCRLGGRGSKRVRRGGFASERDAAEALGRELERLRRQRRLSRSLTLAQLVEVYLAQHASLTMIDRHYGHLARDGREHAIRLLDELSAEQRPRSTLVDAAWTSKPTAGVSRDNAGRG